MSIYLECNDKRNQYLYHKLQTKNQQPKEWNVNVVCKSGDVVVFSPARKLTEEDVAGFASGTTVFGGNQTEQVLQLLQQKMVRYENYLLNEPFVVKNAMLTAEGVLPLLVGATPKSLYENNILVVGTGRVGKAILHLLQKLQLRFSVLTFHEEKVAECQYFTQNILLPRTLKDQLNQFDIVINTAQTLVFDETLLNQMQPQTVVLEIASTNCLNSDLASKKGISYVLAPALPSKVAHETAAELMWNFICEKTNLNN